MIHILWILGALLVFGYVFGRRDNFQKRLQQSRAARKLDLPPRPAATMIGTGTSPASAPGRTGAPAAGARPAVTADEPPPRSMTDEMIAKLSQSDPKAVARGIANLLKE